MATIETEIEPDEFGHTIELDAGDTAVIAGNVGGQGLVLYIDGASELWLTTDGSDPEVDGVRSRYVPAVPARLELRLQNAVGVRVLAESASSLRVEKGW